MRRQLCLYREVGKHAPDSARRSDLRKIVIQLLHHEIFKLNFQLFYMCMFII